MIIVRCVDCGMDLDQSYERLEGKWDLNLKKLRIHANLKHNGMGNYIAYVLDDGNEIIDCFKISECD